MVPPRAEPRQGCAQPDGQTPCSQPGWERLISCPSSWGQLPICVAPEDSAGVPAPHASLSASRSVDGVRDPRARRAAGALEQFTFLAELGRARPSGVAWEGMLPCSRERSGRAGGKGACAAWGKEGNVGLQTLSLAGKAGNKQSWSRDNVGTR